MCISDKEFHQIQQDLRQQDEEELNTMQIPLKEGDQTVSSTRSFHSLVPAASADPAERTLMSQNSQKTAHKKENKEKSNNCAYTTTYFLTQKCIYPVKSRGIQEPKYAQQINWKELVNREFDMDSFWTEYHQKRPGSTQKYEEALAELKNENDTFRKTSLFIAALILKLGRTPELDEALDKYMDAGLNRNPEQRTLNRVNRFRSCLNYLTEKYDTSQKGYTLNWKIDCNNVIKSVKSYLPEELHYRQGKRIKSYTVEEAAFVYYVILSMEKAEQNGVLKDSLTYDHAGKLFQREFGKKCGRNKMAQILKVLQESKLIEKVGSYKVGLKGNCYRARKAPV